MNDEVELDVGWAAASFLIVEVARQVVGNKFAVTVIPDPDGKNPQKKAGIYVEVRSLIYEDLLATMVIGYDKESLDSVRFAMSAVTARLYEAEIEKEIDSESNPSGIIIPDKKLLIPR